MRTDEINYTEQVVLAAETFFDRYENSVGSIEQAKEELFDAIRMYRDHHNPDPDNYLDHDGYPTELVLKKIEQWHYSRGWASLMEFVRSIWYYADDGYWTKQNDVVVREYPGYKRIADVYKISTVGWSGNESIIGAMKRNWMFWQCCWEQSRVGGHYIFHVTNDELSTNHTLPTWWAKDTEPLEDEVLTDEEL